jgi:hypothetical protein
MGELRSRQSGDDNQEPPVPVAAVNGVIQEKPWQLQEMKGSGFNIPIKVAGHFPQPHQAETRAETT